MVWFWKIEGIFKPKHVSHITQRVECVPLELKGCGIDDGFKYGAQLSFCICCTIKETVKETTNHGFFEIPFQIGKILSQQCRWEDALHFAEKALVLNQGHGAVYALKGLCLAAMEKRPEAIAAYTQSVKINPNNADALSALGCLYDAQNENPDICRSFLEQSVALAPNNGLYHHRLGRWHQKHQQFEEAKAAYRQAIAWGHDDAGQMAVVEKELKTETMPTKLRTG